VSLALNNCQQKPREQLPMSDARFQASGGTMMSMSRWWEYQSARGAESQCPDRWSWRPAHGLQVAPPPPPPGTNLLDLALSIRNSCGRKHILRFRVNRWPALNRVTAEGDWATMCPIETKATIGRSKHGKVCALLISGSRRRPTSILFQVHYNTLILLPDVAKEQKVFP